MPDRTTTDPIVAAYFDHHRGVGLLPGGTDTRNVGAYPGELPDALASHYVWTQRMGHCVLALSPGNAAKFGDYATRGALHTLCVPVPVRSALRGYELFLGHPVVDCLEYSETTGYFNVHEHEDREP